MRKKKLDLHKTEAGRQEKKKRQSENSKRYREKKKTKDKEERKKNREEFKATQKKTRTVKRNHYRRKVIDKTDMIKNIMPWLTTDINPFEGWDTMTEKNQQWMSTAGRLGILPHNIKDRIIAMGGYPDKILLDEIRTTTINTVIKIIDKYAPKKYITHNKTKKKKKNNDKKNNSLPNPTQPPPPSPSPTTAPPTPPQNKKPHKHKNKRKYKPHPAGKDEETDSAVNIRPANPSHHPTNHQHVDQKENARKSNTTSQTAMRIQDLQTSLPPSLPSSSSS